ncbi:MAG: ABC transporter permease [Bdellovibrionales bacterium]|nr:ABC transporter permease [Bdellovibrionales bacterium]
MRRLSSLFQPVPLGLLHTLARHEFSLMEQGTVLGFVLSFLNNCLMLFIFHLLFVNSFLASVPLPWLYLMIGIVQWNLYVQASLAGFSSLVYRQKIVMGFAFPREIMILARSAAVFVPYFFELLLIALVAAWYRVIPTREILWLPVLLVSQWLFCAGLFFFFALVGVLHKNVIPFWNLMFRVLSFATPIFYVPTHFGSPWIDKLYGLNPFTIFMIWMREMAGVNGFHARIQPHLVLGGSLAVFLAGYALFRKFEHKIGDHL